MECTETVEHLPFFPVVFQAISMEVIQCTYKLRVRSENKNNIRLVDKQTNDHDDV